MALTKDLPIYKVAYNLLSVATDVTKNMPREYKLFIGAKIREECVELVVLIFRANCAQDKRPHLGELLERLQVLDLLFRLSKEKRFISVGQYAGAIELTDSIGKQAKGWQRASASSPDA